MRLPSDIGTRRGGEFLDLMAQFADQWSQHFRIQEIKSGDDRESASWANAFMAFHNMAMALKFAQQEHIDRMKRNRAEGKRVYSETDPAVDAAINAARSAFMKPLAADQVTKS